MSDLSDLYVRYERFARRILSPSGANAQTRWAMRAALLRNHLRRVEWQYLHGDDPLAPTPLGIFNVHAQ